MNLGEKDASILLEVRHLTISFQQYESGWRQRRITPVKDLSLQARRGKITAVVGASGSGKSLLAHALLGLLPYNASMEGEIRWKGKPLSSGELAGLRGSGIGLIPQNVSCLDPLLRVGEQIVQGKKDPETRRWASELLHRYGLPETVFAKYPHELSGGMRRRALTVSVVMDDPEFLVADEPTPGLHAGAVQDLAGHFRELTGRGKGILLITHELDLALQLADCLVIFFEGSVADQMMAGEFLDGSGCRHPYSKRLRESWLTWGDGGGTA